MSGKREASQGTANAANTSAAATAWGPGLYGFSEICLGVYVSAVTGTGVGIQFFLEGGVSSLNGSRDASTNGVWAVLKDVAGSPCSTAMLDASHASGYCTLWQVNVMPEYIRLRYGMQSAGAGSYATFGFGSTFKV
mgnify:CR=1 FL=1